MKIEAFALPIRMVSDHAMTGTIHGELSSINGRGVRENTPRRISKYAGLVGARLQSLKLISSKGL